MNKNLVRILLGMVSTALLTLSTINLEAQTPAATPAQTISELSWLAGDWQTAAGGRSQTDEHWTHPAGGSMLGLSRTVAGGRARV